MNTKEKLMKPRIFVSSTFYDLKYIREELSRFILEKNYEPILFENGNIGYTPNSVLDTSCYEAMNNSDMAILIIGGRYGSPSSENNEMSDFKKYISVTRQEFRSANESKIPIYIFVDNKVYTEFELYDNNASDLDTIKNIRFNYVDNINIFDFIKEIKLLGLPMFQFSTIKDIEHILNEQWADLMKKYLTLLRQESQTQTMQKILEKVKKSINSLDEKISVVGNEVYKDTTDSFDEKLAALSLSNCIKDNIQVFNNDKSDKRGNLTLILDGLIDVLLIVPDKDKIEFNKFSEMISNSLNHKGIKIAFLNFDLIIRKDLFVQAHTNTALHDEVIDLMLENYDSIVLPYK